MRAGRRASSVHSMSQGEKAPLTLRETPVGAHTQRHKLSAVRTSQWLDALQKQYVPPLSGEK
jgi:hypothetical protein